MASDLELEIHQHLSQYVNGEIELHEFEDWLIPAVWDLADSDDDEARKLAGSIHNLIAEASYGDRTFESFREELTRLAIPFVPQEQQVRVFLIVVSNGNISLPRRVNLSWSTPSYYDAHPRITSKSVSTPALWERLDVEQQMQVG